jgi:hypothetical protein
MEMEMTKFLTALAVTFIVSASLAQAAPFPLGDQVYCSGKLVGQDPDPSIRAQLKRECANTGD